MAGGPQHKWVLLSDGLPPTLNKVLDATDLKPNESPDSYGLDPAGYLFAGSCPIGTARVDKTYTIGAATYHYWFNRLWTFAGTKVKWGAPDYTSVYLAQGRGELDFWEDASPIVTILPMSGTVNAIVVFKTTGAYLIQNADSQRDDFAKSNLIQEAHIANASHATEMGGAVYFTNASGFFVLQGDGTVLELSAPVRTSIAPFASSALTIDYNKRYVIGGANQWCWDALYKRLFDYSATGFRYTSPTLKMKAKGYEANPFTVDAVAMELRFKNTSNGTISFQTNVGDAGWNPVQLHNIPNSALNPAEDLCRTLIQLENPRNGRRFKLRITALSSNLEVQSIYCSSDDYVMEGYTV